MKKMRKEGRKAKEKLEIGGKKCRSGIEDKGQE